MDQTTASVVQQDPVLHPRDITAVEGLKITAEAATWKDTPYAEIGDRSKKNVSGDCSGSTYLIFKAAGYPYPYKEAGGFRQYANLTGRFRELGPTEKPQDGDVLSWLARGKFPNHMAIYSNFAPNSPDATTSKVGADGKSHLRKNDMWTAHRLGVAYSAEKVESFRKGDPPKIFRYQK